MGVLKDPGATSSLAIKYQWKFVICIFWKGRRANSPLVLYIEVKISISVQLCTCVVSGNFVKMKVGKKNFKKEKKKIELLINCAFVISEIFI